MILQLLLSYTAALLWGHIPLEIEGLSYRSVELLFQTERHQNKQGLDRGMSNPGSRWRL